MMVEVQIGDEVRCYDQPPWFVGPFGFNESYVEGTVDAIEGNAVMVAIDQDFCDGVQWET